MKIRHKESMMKPLFAVAGLVLLSTGTFASDWQISSQDSTVNFISIKKGDIAEVHRFAEVSGKLGSDGQFSLSIPLTSVMTNIDIRDLRMKTVLFETEKFPAVTLSAKVEPETVDKLKAGEADLLSIEARVELHGVSKLMTVSVRMVKLAQGTMLLASEYPLIVNASDFGLSPGIEKLRELAGLNAISQAVPVSFILTLTR